MRRQDPQNSITAIDILLEPDLDKVYATAERVLAGADITHMQLEAFKY